MNRSIVKPIVFGILFGTAVFFVPFLVVRTIFLFMIIGLVFRLLWWGKGGRHRQHYHLAYADKIRNMSDEEYAAFKAKAGHHHCYHRGHGHRSNSESK